MNWALARNAGAVLPSGHKVRINERRGVMPDVQFIRKGRGHLAHDKGMENAAPDLAVEIISPSSRGYESNKKLRWCAEIGVPESWIIDPDAQSLERLVLGPDRHCVIADVLEGDPIFTPPSLEGLESPLRELGTMPED